MQNLRDQLLKAGIITEEQASRAAADKSSRNKPRHDKPRPDEKKTGEKKRDDRVHVPLAKQPLNRMLDLSDPRLLKIFQAIEAHRFREDPRGDHAFHFTLRDGRVRKMMVKTTVSEALEAGRLAIVESGNPNNHVLVEMAAVPVIREADPEAVRFANL